MFPIVQQVSLAALLIYSNSRPPAECAIFGWAKQFRVSGHLLLLFLKLLATLEAGQPLSGQKARACPVANSCWPSLRNFLTRKHSLARSPAVVVVVIYLQKEKKKKTLAVVLMPWVSLKPKGSLGSQQEGGLLLGLAN